MNELKPREWFTFEEWDLWFVHASLLSWMHEAVKSTLGSDSLIEADFAFLPRTPNKMKRLQENIFNYWTLKTVEERS